MARAPLDRLAALQQARIDEIASIGARMRERAPDTLNRTIVQTRIRTVQERWAEIRRTHDEILLRTDAARHAYVTENRFNAMTLTHEETLDWLFTRALQLPHDGNEGVEVAPRQGEGFDGDADQNRRLNGNANARRRPREDDELDERTAKLPRLDLPSFSGNYEDWESFADVFTTLVHNAPRLANTTKLQYLKSCLKGAAADLVKDVTILGANYTSTWQALKDRFYNPRLTVNKLLDSLSSLPYMKKEAATELRRFVDAAQRSVRALTNSGAPVAHWDMWLVHTLEIRLDPESRKMWESELIQRDRQLALLLPDAANDTASRFPKFVDLVAFLERRAQSLMVISSDSKDDKKAPQPSTSGSGSRRVHHAQASGTSKKTTCAICSGEHFITRCASFAEKSVKDRNNEVRRLRLCFNCLGSHKLKDCKSKYSCKVCKEKHHSLIHYDKRNKERQESSSGGNAPIKIQANVAQTAVEPTLLSNACRATECSILLATAQVIIIGPDGRKTRARALLDQGSEATFISESLVQSLRLPKGRVETTVTGVGGCDAGRVNSATSFTIQSQTDSDFKLEVNAFVLPRLTSALPSRNIIKLDLHQFDKLTLADPEFHRSSRIDILIGADLYGQLLRSGVKSFPSTLVVAQNTALGWVVSGPTRGRSSRRAAPVHHATVKALRCAVNDDLSEVLQKLWTVEEVPTTTNLLKPADEACEKFFADTHTRDADGRFRVRLPLISKPPSAAAETRRMALGSLRHQQRRFANDRPLATAYTEFMDTYLGLGHMEPVPRAEIDNPDAWYLPNHGIEQGKLRVVFDASRRTREKQCLNDFLMTGPPLQGDLSLILTNWRTYRHVFTADIVKMFRQIRVAREDQDLQRIVWSPSPLLPPIDYRLTTVTYGTACAPYLAIRTLLQLARDEESRFPLGADCLRTNTYVDDTFAGADDLPTAKRRRDELVQILKSAGIELDKWAANHADLLPTRDQSNEHSAIRKIDSDSDVKTLGVHWRPLADEFSFSAPKFKHDNEKLTKRTLYSEIARLFDPLGWLSPITVVAKIMMQDLWIEKCGWDEPVSSEISNRWQAYRQSLSALPTLSINRWLGLSQNVSFEIHGFSDASSRAYAAAVYIRITLSNGQSRSELLGSRTKVASVKTISIPNLELCGATLLVKYVCHLRKLDFLKHAPIRLWSDSQIVLMWLKKHPCHWKTFVANRVSLIQTELPSATWAHVPTKQNPADLATRGATPTELKSNDIWWHGPAWLVSEPQNWPQAPKAVQALHAQRATKKNEPGLLLRYSNLKRLLHVTAWMLRPFLQRRRSKAGQGSYDKLRLSVEELDNARDTLIKLAQAQAYAGEIALLRAQKPLLKRNPLCKLRPFLDYDGILRVGGRLNNADLPCHIQHPPILPRDSALSRLFVRDAHERALHGGPTLTTSILLRFAWVVGMRPLVKSAIHKCVTCQRHKPRLAQQLMGNLPAERVTPARPFTTTGLDYAGPIQVRTSKGRGQRAYKGYIAVFICFVTKAIHLELVGDLTTKSFLAAFRRFVSRRGLCKLLFSDNATTFKGADAELRAMFQDASTFYEDIARVLADDGTSWTFIPPTTPHYGGLWEAGVKSTKNLLKKTIGEHTLTFEELTTVLAEIEACLNSRPLRPLTTDPDDLQALTPSHFLLGTASGIIPDQPTPGVPENRLDRFQLLQRMRDQFWNRWSSEYVLQLQEREKWRGPTANFGVGQLVLIKDDRYPASKWPLGRVVEVHPGPDNLVRVVTVKTATNTLRRHIACLAPLNLDQHQELATMAEQVGVIA